MRVRGLHRAATHVGLGCAYRRRIDGVAGTETPVCAAALYHASASPTSRVLLDALGDLSRGIRRHPHGRLFSALRLIRGQLRAIALGL